MSNKKTQEGKSKDNPSGDRVKPNSGGADRIAVIIIVGVLIAVLIPVSVFGYIKYYMNAPEKEVQSLELETGDVEVEPVEDADEVVKEEAVVGSAIEKPHRLYLGGTESYLDVPAGWSIIRFDVDYRPLTDEEKVTHNVDGYWPIHESKAIVLGKDRATITFTSREQFVPFATGFYPDPMYEEAVVLREPTNDTNGIARYMNEDGDYEYYLITDNPDYGSGEPAMFEADVQYLFAIHAFALNSFVYSGSDSLLTVADNIFVEACLNNTSGWCYSN